MITITATTPTGQTMHWSSQGWTSHPADAKDFKTVENAAQTATWEYPFKGLARLGWRIQVQSGNQAVAYRENKK